jgi:hypothetical protein
MPELTEDDLIKTVNGNPQLLNTLCSIRFSFEELSSCMITNSELKVVVPIDYRSPYKIAHNLVSGEAVTNWKDALDLAIIQEYIAQEINDLASNNVGRVLFGNIGKQKPTGPGKQLTSQGKDCWHIWGANSRNFNVGYIYGTGLASHQCMGGKSSLIGDPFRQGVGIITMPCDDIEHLKGVAFKYPGSSDSIDLKEKLTEDVNSKLSDLSIRSITERNEVIENKKKSRFPSLFPPRGSTSQVKGVEPRDSTLQAKEVETIGSTSQAKEVEIDGYAALLTSLTNKLSKTSPEFTNIELWWIFQNSFLLAKTEVNQEAKTKFINELKEYHNNNHLFDYIFDENDSLKKGCNLYSAYLLLTCAEAIQDSSGAQPELINFKQQAALTAKFESLETVAIKNSQSLGAKPQECFKGWGFEFSGEDVMVEEGKCYVKITQIYPGSVLKGTSITKGDYVLLGDVVNLEINEGKIENLDLAAQMMRGKTELTVTDAEKNMKTVPKWVHKKIFFPKGDNYVAATHFASDHFHDYVTSLSTAPLPPPEDPAELDAAYAAARHVATSLVAFNDTDPDKTYLSSTSIAFAAAKAVVLFSKVPPTTNTDLDTVLNANNDNIANCVSALNAVDYPFAADDVVTTAEVTTAFDVSTTLNTALTNNDYVDVVNTLIVARNFALNIASRRANELATQQADAAKLAAELAAAKLTAALNDSDEVYKQVNAAAAYVYRQEPSVAADNPSLALNASIVTTTTAAFVIRVVNVLKDVASADLAASALFGALDKHNVVDLANDLTNAAGTAGTYKALYDALNNALNDASVAGTDVAGTNAFRLVDAATSLVNTCSVVVKTIDELAAKTTPPNEPNVGAGADAAAAAGARAAEQAAADEQAAAPAGASGAGATPTPPLPAGTPPLLLPHVLPDERKEGRPSGSTSPRSNDTLEGDTLKPANGCCFSGVV